MLPIMGMNGVRDHNGTAYTCALCNLLHVCMHVRDIASSVNAS